MNSQKNLFIAGLLCIVIWLSTELFLTKDVQNKQQEQQVSAEKADVSLQKDNHFAIDRNLSEEEALKKSGFRIPFENNCVKGSIDLRGGLIDDASLLGYKENPSDPKSEFVRVLYPSLSEKGYFAFFGWDGEAENQKISFPDEKSLWQTKQTALSSKDSLSLTWTSPEGVVFEQQLSIDEKYMMTVFQTVKNTLTVPLKVKTHSSLVRHGPVKTSGYFVLYEGPLGVYEGRLKEVSYKDIDKQKTIDLLPSQKEIREKKGWLGYTDKYFLSALVMSPDPKMVGEFSTKSSDYYASMSSSLKTLAPGESFSSVSHLFIGPKNLRLLDSYEKYYAVDHFDLAIDFGWFYFLTKPMLILLSWLKEVFGSFALAIVVMTIGIKMLFFPLAIKSYRSMAAMKALQPQIEALKSKYASDKLKMNEALMQLYKKSKVNPASGCLPMLVQIPVFFALYKVLFVSIEMRGAPFYGWIQDLSMPDPTSIFNLFGILPFSLPAFLQIGGWPILMGMSMILQQRLSGPPSSDPAHKVMFLYIMPIVFTYMLSQFPVGLVIYWTISNLLTVAQQWAVTKWTAYKTQQTS